MNYEGWNNNCLSSAASDEFADSFIKHFDKGGMIYPSKAALSLCHQLERALTEYFAFEILHRDSVLDILDKIKATGTTNMRW